VGTGAFSREEVGLSQGGKPRVFQLNGQTSTKRPSSRKNNSEETGISLGRRHWGRLNHGYLRTPGQSPFYSL